MLAPQADFLSVSGDDATPALLLLPLRQGGCCHSGREIELSRVRGRGRALDGADATRRLFWVSFKFGNRQLSAKSAPNFGFLRPPATPGEVCEQHAPDPRPFRIDARQMSSRMPIHPSIGPPQCLVFSSSHLKSPRASSFEKFQSRVTVPAPSIPIAFLAPCRRTIASLAAPCNFITLLHPLRTLSNLPIQHLQLSAVEENIDRVDELGSEARGDKGRADQIEHIPISHGGKSHAGPQRS
jgi:hypothetical protein